MGILDGRVAVVTGSGRGIGREFALSMAREGANIVINDVGVSLDGQGTDEDPAAQTVNDIKALGVGAIASYGSVTDYDAAGNTIQAAIDEFSAPWQVTQLGARSEYSFRGSAPRDGAEAAAADDFELQQYLHLHALNRGILMTPFHNMALMCPATTTADVDRHTVAFREAVVSLYA